MRAILIGYGKMGKLIQQAAIDSDVTIAAIVDHNFSDDALLSQDGIKRGRTLTQELIHGSDIAIDFSSSEGIIERLRTLLKDTIPVVVGTTGWEEQKEKARTLVKEYDGAMVVSSNFSIGVLAFTKLVKEARKLFSVRHGYATSIMEIHHAAKKDSPSGTALMLQDAMEQQVPIAALRAGTNPGEHTVIFESSFDEVRLTHSAKTRDGFAKGALAACRFLKNKKGYFTFESLLEEIV